MQNQYLLQHRVFIGSNVQELYKQAPVAVDSFVMIISQKITLKLYVWSKAFYRRFLSLLFIKWQKKLYPSEFKINKSYISTIILSYHFPTMIITRPRIICSALDFFNEISYMSLNLINYHFKAKNRHLPHRLFLTQDPSGFWFKYM